MEDRVLYRFWYYRLHRNRWRFRRSGSRNSSSHRFCYHCRQFRSGRRPWQCRSCFLRQLRRKRPRLGRRQISIERAETTKRHNLDGLGTSTLDLCIQILSGVISEMDDGHHSAKRQRRRLDDKRDNNDDELFYDEEDRERLDALDDFSREKELASRYDAVGHTMSEIPAMSQFVGSRRIYQVIPVSHRLARQRQREELLGHDKASPVQCKPPEPQAETESVAAPAAAEAAIPSSASLFGEYPGS
eukprot:284817953_6